MMIGKKGSSKGQVQPKLEKIAPLFALTPPPLPDKLDSGRIMCMHQPEPKWVTQVRNGGEDGSMRRRSARGS